MPQDLANGASTRSSTSENRISGGRSGNSCRTLAPPNSPARRQPSAARTVPKCASARQFVHSLRRLRCRMALSFPPGGFATPVGRPKTRSPVPVFKGLRQAVAAVHLEIVPRPANCLAQRMRDAALDAGPEATQASQANGCAFPHRPSRRSRHLSLCADAANPTAPNQPCADPTTQFAAHQRTGTAFYLQHRVPHQTMLVTGTNSRPSTAPTSSSMLLGGGTGSPRRRAAPGVRRRRQRTAALSSANAFRQPARCRRPSSNSNASHTRPRCDERRPRSPATPASSQNCREGFARPDSESPCCHRSEAAGRSSAKPLWGIGS